jgi:hypothetical protein
VCSPYFLLDTRSDHVFTLLRISHHFFSQTSSMLIIWTPQTAFDKRIRPLPLFCLGFVILIFQNLWGVLSNTLYKYVCGLILERVRKNHIMFRSCFTSGPSKNSTHLVANITDCTSAHLVANIFSNRPLRALGPVISRSSCFTDSSFRLVLARVFFNFNFDDRS